MRRMMSQFLRVFLVAVVFATGSLSGALACGDTGALAGIDHAGHDHGTHVHGPDNETLSEAHHAVLTETVADPSDVDRDGIFGLLDCDGCPHMHAHCCAQMAIPAGDYGLKLSHATSTRVSEAAAPLLLGQLFYPLLRPPSATA